MALFLIPIITYRDTHTMSGARPWCSADEGTTPVAARFMPETFTNQIQAAIRGPRLLVVTDARADHPPLTETSYACPPLHCVTDSPLQGSSFGGADVDAGRRVLRMREHPWEVIPDLQWPIGAQEGGAGCYWEGPRKNFRENGRCQLLRSLLLSQRWQTGLTQHVHVPSVPI